MEPIEDQFRNALKGWIGAVANVSVVATACLILAKQSKDTPWIMWLLAIVMYVLLIYTAADNTRELKKIGKAITSKSKRFLFYLGGLSVLVGLNMVPFTIALYSSGIIRL
ncbi:hypothetical protein HA051_16570 [Chromobacterium vaccinii]|nr:hypothetical protein [Chromobacterium vaccinii]